MLVRDALRPNHMFDTAIPALILRLDRNIFHHGTLGGIRSLGRAGVEVHAVLEGNHAPASCSRYLHRMYPWHPKMLNPDTLLTNLQKIAENVRSSMIIIPMDDASAIFVAEHADDLADRFLLPQQKPTLPRQVADKENLAKICGKLAIPHPEIYVPHSLDELTEAVRQLGLPLVAKWSRPWLPLPSRTTLLHSLDEAVDLFALTPIAGCPLVLQSYLPYGRDVNWFFQGYFDFSSSCLLGEVGRKERACPPHTGITTLGRWQPNPQLQSMAQRLAIQLGYSGILDLDFRYDPVSRNYYLLDFNPRPGAQFRLFTDQQGLDLVRVLYLDLTGQPVPEVQAQYDRAYLVENYDLISIAVQLWNRSLSISDWRHSLRGIAELAWFADDDLRPFFSMALQWLKYSYQRLRTMPSGSSSAITPRAINQPTHARRPTAAPHTTDPWPPAPG